MLIRIKRTLTAELLALTCLCVSLCLSLAGMRYLLLPRLTTIVALRQEVARYSTLITGSTQYDELKNEIRQKQKLLEQKHTLITQGLADPRDLSSLLQLIFDKAWESRIKLDKTTPQEEVRTKESLQYPLVLELTNSYTNFGTFISALEKIPQIVRIERVAVTALDAGQIQAKLLVTCSLALQE